MTDAARRQRSEQRVRYWGEAYLASTRKSYGLAERFFNDGDAYTAYLYLFVAFNNLYCLLARFDGREPDKIRAALERVPLDGVDSIYTPDLVRLISELNDWPTEQFVLGPDAGASVSGIVNMKDYFLGKPAAQCVAHVEAVADPWAPGSEKRRTLQDVAASLLYTIRNNQFHAVKGAQRLADQTTLQTAYRVLQPIVDLLLPPAEAVVRGDPLGAAASRLESSLEDE